MKKTTRATRQQQRNQQQSDYQCEAINDLTGPIREQHETPSNTTYDIQSNVQQQQQQDIPSTIVNTSAIDDLNTNLETKPKRTIRNKAQLKSIVEPVQPVQVEEKEVAAEVIKEPVVTNRRNKRNQKKLTEENIEILPKKNPKKEAIASFEAENSESREQSKAAPEPQPMVSPKKRKFIEKTLVEIEPPLSPPAPEPVAPVIQTRTRRGKAAISAAAATVAVNKVETVQNIPATTGERRTRLKKNEAKMQVC